MPPGSGGRGFDMDIAHPRSDVRARDADVRAQDADPCAEHEAQRAKQRVPDDKRKRGVRPWEMARVSRKTWYKWHKRAAEVEHH